MSLPRPRFTIVEHAGYPTAYTGRLGAGVPVEVMIFDRWYNDHVVWSSWWGRDARGEGSIGGRWLEYARREAAERLAALEAEYAT